MAPISLQQAFQALQNLLKDISDVPQGTFVQWCEFINEFVYRFLVGVDPERFIKEVFLNVVAGQVAYPLQTDFHDMQTWDTGFFITDGNLQNTGVRLALTTPGTSSGNNSSNTTPFGMGQNGLTGYYINGNNFIFTPLPVQGSVLIQRYIPTITPLASINQYFTMDGTITGFPIVPYEYLQYILRALAAQYAVWDEEIGAESYADARFVRTLDELCENIRRQPQAMPQLDFSQIY